MLSLAILTRLTNSTKHEVKIIMGVLILIFLLPVISIMSLTNVSALFESGNTLYDGPVSTTNTYVFGYCTFWAAKKRADVGLPIPNTWGDAHTWDDYARLVHYTVDHIPAKNALMQTDAGDLGHVAFVDSVNADGSWTVSEMNYKWWDIVSSRTFKASDAKNYNFIH